MNATVMEKYRNDTGAIENICNGGTNPAMRRVLLCVNAVSIVAAITLIFLVMTQRRIQQYGARGWALMEIFLVGAVLLYSVVVLDFLELRSWSCCAIQWLRELGFSCFYGSLVLKIYRNLIENRVRKAHHVYVKEKDMLKYLVLIVVTAATSLLAWTLDELLFLGYGLWLCYKARNTAWVERWQFTAAVAVEIVITLSANLIRYYAWYSSNRDAMYLVSFIQIHLTVSVNILLIMVPKFYYIRIDHGRTRSMISPNRSSRAHPSLAKLRDNLVNGTIDFAEVPITDMNPEDIRAELKRVYTQLRMFKLKNIYQENPHISSKRKGKKQGDRTCKKRTSIPSMSIAMLSRAEKSRFEEEESRSSTMETEAINSVLPAANVSQLVTSPTDLTVESSPHNIYLGIISKLRDTFSL